MSALSMRKFALITVACLLTVLLLSLSACAMPRERERRGSTTDDITGTVDPMPQGDEGLEDLIPSDTDGEARARGNLGDTNGDGAIEDRREAEQSTAPEQDPMHAAQNAAEQSGGWITALLCILAVISLILIIVAMIPKKRI